MARRFTQAVSRFVQARADNLCEYCHTSERWQYVPFTVDHVLPPRLGGTHLPDNLALACFHCNRQKGSNVTAIDPESGETVLLFNPRQQTWAEHFAWSADKLLIVGFTPVGRATVQALQLNRNRVIVIRSADVAIGRHPPAGDPILEN